MSISRKLRMSRKKPRINRRDFLKTAATTGALTTGIVASTGTATASDHCMVFRVLGRENYTDYRLEFNDLLDVDMASTTEGNDSQINSHTVEGTVHNGYEDHYWVEWSCTKGYLFNVDIDGEAAVQLTHDYCDPGNTICDTVDPVRIDATGYGDYTFGWYAKDTLEPGDNLESPEIEACYPTYSDTGDPQITCEFDPEGVVPGYVDPPDDDPYEVDFGTGHVEGYTDSFFMNGYAHTEGLKYVYGNGDINIDVSYT